MENTEISKIVTDAIVKILSVPESDCADEAMIELDLKVSESKLTELSNSLNVSFGIEMLGSDIKCAVTVGELKYLIKTMRISKGYDVVDEDDVDEDA